MFSHIILKGLDLAFAVMLEDPMIKSRSQDGCLLSQSESISDVNMIRQASNLISFGFGNFS